MRGAEIRRWAIAMAACYMFARAALADEAIVSAVPVAARTVAPMHVQPSAPVLTHAPASVPPSRVVSLNPCIDTILVKIAGREQIAALSFRSRDPGQSVLADVAATYPITYETAEEVVTLKPDVVLATKHSALATRNALKRVGIRVVMLEVPESIETSFVQIRSIAHVIGRPREGDALIARLQSSIDAARGDSHITALIFQPAGLTPGNDTLIGELMRVVGFENVADRYGIKRWGVVGLEQIVANPPALLLTGEVSSRGPTRSERLLQHPALRHMRSDLTRATFPATRLYCGGPVIELALQSLMHARDRAAANNEGRVIPPVAAR